VKLHLLSLFLGLSRTSPLCRGLKFDSGYQVLVHAIVVFVTDMRRLTTGIRSEKCVFRPFRRCANVYLTQS